MKIQPPIGRDTAVAMADGSGHIEDSVMSDTDDHRWDLAKSDEGDLPESDEAFEKKFEEWQGRAWSDWLGKHLTFPFSITREEDDDDAYFSSGAAKAAFRLGHKMEVLGLDGEDVDRGVMIKVREKGKMGHVPLCDVQVTPKSNPNFWPVREYVVWFANRC